MKKNGKLIAAAIAVAALAVLFAGVWHFTRPAVSQGAKTVTVEELGLYMAGSKRKEASVS